MTEKKRKQGISLPDIDKDKDSLSDFINRIEEEVKELRRRINEIASNKNKQIKEYNAENTD